MNDPQKVSDIKGEIADVLLYLVRLSSVLGIDPIEAGLAKVEENRSRTWDF
jgi:NTP pyrophosphatase (non-canonical NTP hydrolase)